MDSRGFTLTEVLVVLIIAGLAVGMLAPRIGSGWDRMQEREFLHQFTAEIRKARLFALRNGRIHRFKINGQERTFGADRSIMRSIPTNVDIFSRDLQQEGSVFVITFFQDGSSKGNELEIVMDNHQTLRMRIHPLTGAVHYRGR